MALCVLCVGLEVRIELAAELLCSITRSSMTSSCSCSCSSTDESEGNLFDDQNQNRNSLKRTYETYVIETETSISEIHVKKELEFPVQTYTGISIEGTNIGRKNQDSMFMFEDQRSRTVVLGCLDGHGEYGHQISMFFKNGIEQRLFSHPTFHQKPTRAIEEIVKRLEFEARCRRDFDTRFSGTTLVMVVIQETRVISVNVGDSRAILGCRDHAGRVMSHSLTSDHIPDEPNEFARIMSAGGRIYRTVSTSSTPVSPGQRRPHVWGPCRVWLPDIDAPGLAMSRSLCDDIIHTVGVTSTLEFREHHFDHCKDCVLVIATDGLWQYLSNQEVIDIAMKECEPTKASGRLIKEARKRYLQKEKAADDTTLCIAYLRGCSGNHHKV